MAFRGGKRLPARELRRKLFHVALGTAFLVVIAKFGFLMYAAIALLFFGFGLSVLHSRHPIRLVGLVLDRFDREGDKLPGMGIITFFLGVSIVWLVFPKDIAMIGVAVMTFGDPMASVVGITLGTHSCPYNRKKTLEGTMAFVLASFFAVLPLAGSLLAASGALGGAVVESFRHPKGSLLNDNVTIPLGASSAALFVSALSGL